MASKHAIALFLLTALSAGCLGGGDPGSPELATAGLGGDLNETAAADGAAPAASTPPAEVPCNGPYANYGVHSSIGDLYIQSRDGSAFARVYRESNGRAGWQGVDDCPQDHDEVLAEVLDPLAAPPACSGHSRVLFLHWTDQSGVHYLVGSRDGRVLQLYDESNGQKELQMEGCAASPDTKVVGLPVGAGLNA